MRNNEWREFINEIKCTRERLGFEDGEECFFRGHRENSWDLLPSLQRHCSKACNSRIDKIQELESDLFFEFQARSAQLHHGCRDDWELLFTMRHHGVATRLLDWTETLGVALYFAMRNAAERDEPHVWLLNPYRLNQESWGARDLIAPKYLGYDDDEEEFWSYSDLLVEWDGMGFNKPVALYPVQRNNRLHAQRGYFTVHGDDPKPLDQLNPECVAKVVIPPGAREGALEFLEWAGINDYSMFPDLDGLSKDLHRKNRIDGTDPRSRP